MNTRMYHLHLILAITFLFFSFSAAICNKEDKKALIAFKNSFPNNTFSSSWETESDCCSWEGIVCDGSTGTRVTSLIFIGDPYDPEYPERGHANLIGTIPPSIGDLTALETVAFENLPGLVGPLAPPEMANLKNLQLFVVYNCSLTGPIPSFVSEWTSLTHLTINQCPKLKGPIPPSLGNLVNLTYITLYHNKLSGTIPASLFSRLNKGLQPQLDLSNNMLTGPIPQSFAGIDSLYIDVSYNKLCGPIPNFTSSISTNAVYFAHNKCLCGPPLAACK